MKSTPESLPLLGERVSVVHVHVDGSAAHPLRLDAGSREMDRQLVAVGERISLVMMRGTEAQLLVVGNARGTSETTKIGSTLTTRRTLEA